MIKKEDILFNARRTISRYENLASKEDSHLLKKISQSLKIGCDCIASLSNRDFSVDDITWQGYFNKFARLAIEVDSERQEMSWIIIASLFNCAELHWSFSIESLYREGIEQLETLICQNANNLIWLVSSLVWLGQSRPSTRFSEIVLPLRDSLLRLKQKIPEFLEKIIIFTQSSDLYIKNLAQISVLTLKKHMPSKIYKNAVNSVVNSTVNNTILEEQLYRKKYPKLYREKQVSVSQRVKKEVQKIRNGLLYNDKIIIWEAIKILYMAGNSTWQKNMLEEWAKIEIQAFKSSYKMHKDWDIWPWPK